jgi:hypothetical protein
MYSLGNIVGLSVVAVKSDYNGITKFGVIRRAKYIMFSDGITFIVLSDDVTESAYVIRVIQDAKMYNKIMQNLDANEDI